MLAVSERVITAVRVLDEEIVDVVLGDEVTLDDILLELLAEADVTDDCELDADSVPILDMELEGVSEGLAEVDSDAEVEPVLTLETVAILVEVVDTLGENVSARVF